MADDLRARISKLARDVKKAVEIGDQPAIQNGGIGFDVDAFARLFGYEGPPLTESELAVTETFSDERYAALFALSQLELMKTAQAPPAPAEPKVISDETSGDVAGSEVLRGVVHQPERFGPFAPIVIRDGSGE